MFKYLILGAILGANLFGATTVDDGSFGTIYDVFKMWISGSFGLAIALLGMMGSLITYMLTNALKMSGLGTYSVGPATPEFLIRSFMFSIFVGGVVGLIETMAGLGRVTFG